MSEYFNCKLWDKSFKIKSKKKHLNSTNHKNISDKIILRYIIQNPDFIKIDNTLKIYILDYTKKFEFYTIICKWILHFSNNIIIVKADLRTYTSIGRSLRNFLLSKVQYFENYDHKFSHISEMSITFMADWKRMTYEYYLSLPKSMLEWN